jgi:hypothetical protein
MFFAEGCGHLKRCGREVVAVGGNEVLEVEDWDGCWLLHLWLLVVNKTDAGTKKPLGLYPPF